LGVEERTRGRHAGRAEPGDEHALVGLALVGQDGREGVLAHCGVAFPGRIALERPARLDREAAAFEESQATDHLAIARDRHFVLPRISGDLDRGSVRGERLAGDSPPDDSAGEERAGLRVGQRDGARPGVKGQFQAVAADRRGPGGPGEQRC